MRRPGGLTEPVRFHLRDLCGSTSFLDLAGLVGSGLRQGQGQDAIFEVGADLVLVDFLAQREPAGEAADFVLTVDRTESLLERLAGLDIPPV
jgi:hypothetical protein